MGYLNDSLDFEKFFAKDLLSGIKKDPKRLVLGVDPASTWAWNQVLGRDDKPLVDQMGGPYDGRVFSFGHGDGGVYDRAQAAGINTKSASMNHDAAHLIAASYAVGGGLGNTGGEGGTSGGYDFFNGPRTNFSTGMPSTGANPAAGISGIAGPVAGPGGGAGIEAGAGAGSGMGAMDYAKLGMGLMKSAQPQQQQAPAAQPSFGQRLNAGLGQALFPINPQVAQGVDPSYVSQLQNNALLKLGLGMASAGREPGATFGAALGAGLGRASNDLDGAMQTAYQNARQARADRRADTAEERQLDQADRAQAHQQWLETHTLDREKTQDDRAAEDRQFRLQQAEQAQRRWDAEQKAQQQWRQDQLDARNAGTVPTGYRLKQDGTGLEPIPGGPADPSVGKGKITDAERLTAAYAQRMQSASDTIDKLDYVPSASELTAFNYLIGSPGIKQSLANRYMSGEAQQYFQALQDFSRAKLRKESGAVIGKDEISGDLATFFPLPGDSPETIAQKKVARQTALQGMITASGPAYAAAQTQTAATPPKGAGLGQTPPAVRKSVGGKTYVQMNGQWFEDDGAPSSY